MSEPTPTSNTPPTAGGDPVADRRAKLDRIRQELGIDPFGGRVEGLIPLADARACYDQAADEAHKALGKNADPAQDARPTVRVAGRIMLHRDIGKLVFMTLRDATGDLQVAVSKNAVDETAFKLAKLVDLGDIVHATGRLGQTKTGEITVWAAEFALASKSLTPPPEKWHGLQDAELRYRQRYVDLWANPEVMRTMQLRIRIVEEIRQYLRDHGYAEVETPMLQPIHGGAAARPFITHHNALDMRLFLRIAPELYLKRLLVGGFSKVFEINRNFRNEGVSPRHNPEFTMLEAYAAFGSWETMADMVEDMVCTVAMKVFGTLKIEHRSAEAPHANAGLSTESVTRTINLKRPWRRARMDDLVHERLELDFNRSGLSAAEIRYVADLLAARKVREERQWVDENVPAGDIQAHDPIFDEMQSEQREKLVDHIDALSPAEQLVEVYEKLIEPTLIDPCFVTHVPSVCIPLARESKADPFFADVYELVINGVEISPGYTELNDPEVQERHLRHQVGDREEQQQLDEDFINALRVGMPPAGGMGLGIDRLVMMLTGAQSIRDVILFPLMRPEKG